MRKIYSFSDFSSIYEADAVTPTEASKLYDKTLGIILTTALSAYREELDLTIPDYDNDLVKSEVAAVKSSPILDKPGALKTIMTKVQKAAEGNTAPGAKEAVAGFVAGGFKAADALTSLINQYKDRPEELEHINTSINFGLDSWLKNNNLMESVINSGLDYSDELDHIDLNEGDVLFQGKKGAITEVTEDAARLISKLLGLAETPGMGSTVSSLTAKANQIQASLIALKNKKNREINRSDIENARKTIQDLSKQADEMADEMAKQDVTNKEASAILVDALDLIQTAETLKAAYLKAKDEAKAEKIKVSLAVPTIDYAPEETKNVNPEVKKFQELVVDKFKKNKQINSLPQYTKMGTDGKFGPNTRDIIKILKRGFNLPETSGDITKQLVDEIQIQADTIGESDNTRVFKFSDFINISEAAFNVTSAVEYAKELPTYTSASKPVAKSASAVSSASKSSALYKEGSKGAEVAAIQNSLKGNVGDESKSQTFGPLTKKAVMEFQKDNGLKETGEITIEDLKKLADPKRVGGNFGGNWTQSMIAKLAGIETKASAPATKAEEKSTSTQIQTIANEIIDATKGAGTDPEKVLTAIKKIKGKSDLNILNGILKRAFDMKTIDVPGEGEKQIYTYTNAELGIKTRPEAGHNSVQAIINDEMGDDNTGTVQDITDHLKSKGINASYQKDSSGEYKEDSFKIA